MPKEKEAVLSVLPQLASRQNLAAQNRFTEHLIAWQKTAGRHDLPWQKTQDPYRIWLSEIMLQQTQVSTVIPYYARFLGSFPDVQALAAAPIEAVIEHWAGLGYYARARNLHRCAQQIATVHGGKFPETEAQLEELPGIGRSTAAAIAAFAFGRRAAILDGNVKRVLCRQFGIAGFPGAKAVHDRLWELAENLLPENDIEVYTQGLMDLGATLCTRSRPRCGDCPVAAGCVARREGRQGELPEAKPRAAVPERTSTFVLLTDGQRLLLERRPPSGLWGGLLVPPEGEPAAVAARFGLALGETTKLPPFKHVFTHFRLTLEPVLCRIDAQFQAAEPGLEWVEIGRAANAGVPAPIKKLIRAYSQ
jgi:A/G-specific adenine glycosylase